jgi:hypothetical protein
MQHGIDDPRHARGVRYQIATVLAVIVFTEPKFTNFPLEFPQPRTLRHGLEQKP